MRKVSILGLIVFTVAVTFLVTTATDAIYMWSANQTGNNPVSALQLVFLVAYVLFAASLMMTKPGLIGKKPTRVFAFFLILAAIGYVCYYGIGAIAGG